VSWVILLPWAVTNKLFVGLFYTLSTNTLVLFTVFYLEWEIYLDGNSPEGLPLLSILPLVAVLPNC